MRGIFLFILTIFLLTCNNLRASVSDVCQSDTIVKKDSSVVVVDTLKNVTVYKHLPVTGRLNIYPYDIMPHTKGISEIIGSSANDKIMHPLAIKQRKKERHQRKMKKLLEEYDQLKSPNELLKEALRKEGIDPDSLEALRGKR